MLRAWFCTGIADLCLQTSVLFSLYVITTPRVMRDVGWRNVHAVREVVADRKGDVVLSRAAGEVRVHSSLKGHTGAAHVFFTGCCGGYPTCLFDQRCPAPGWCAGCEGCRWCPAWLLQSCTVT